MTKKEQAKAGEGEEHSTSLVGDGVAEESEELHKSQAIEEEYKDLKDRYFRLYADFENSRKRMQRERVQLTQETSEKILSSVLSFLDDFSRALKAAEEAGETAVLQGFQLIYQNFLGTLHNDYGLNPMESVGEKFDPTRHEALSMEEDSHEEISRVITEYQPGYLLRDKVLRTAKVQVSVAPTQKTEDSGNEQKKNIS